MSAPLRRSALESFACPALFHDKYEVGMEDSSPPAQRGIAFHEAAGRYIHKLAEAGQDSDPVLAEQALEEALALRPLAWDLIQDIRQNLWPQHVERFRFDVEAFLAAEERQTHGELTWMPDLVYAYQDILEINDWKTFFVAMTETQAKEAFQTWFYLWQASLIWSGFKTYRMRYVFPRLRRDVAVEFTPNELAEFGDRVQSLVEQIRHSRATNYWPEIPGDHCKYCVRKCSIADDPRRVPLRVTSQAEAEDALKRAVAIGRQYDQLVEALRGWCEQHGEVKVNGLAAHHKPIVARRWSLVDVMDVLGEFGITDLTTLPKMEVSATSLSPLLKTKKRADIGLALLQRAIVKESERFEVSRPLDPGVQKETDDGKEAA